MGVFDILLAIDERSNVLNFTITPSKEFTYFVNRYKVWFDIIILIGSLLSQTLGTLVIIFVRRGLLLHFHLRSLLYIAFFDFIALRVITDVSIILSYCFTDSPIVKTFAAPQPIILFNFLQIFTSVMFVISLSSFILERFLATVMMQVYERLHSYLFVVGSTVSILIISFICTLFFFFVDNTILIFAPPVSFLFILQVGLFFYINTKNNKLYASRMSSNTMTLSMRFQLSENLRTLYVIRNMTAAYFCGNCLVICSFVAYLVINNHELKIFLFFVWQITIFIYAVLMVLVITVSGNLWTTVGKKMLSAAKFRLLKVDKVSHKSNVLSIKTSRGEQMIFNSDQEGNVYFTQLSQSWGT